MLRQLRDDERGIALVLALGILIVLAIVVTAAVQYTTSNARASKASAVRVSARQLAEAGMNAAIATIQPDPTNSADLPTSLATARTVSLGGGTSKYWGAYDSGNGIWTLHATGNQLNPTTASTTAHELVATVTLNPSPIVQSTPPASTNPWTYMWSKRTGNTCDESISTQVAAPFVVMGTLCITSSSGQTGFIGGPLHVRGSYVSLTGTGAKSSKTSSYAAISGGTHLASGTQCKNSYANTSLHTCSSAAATSGDNLAGFDRSTTGISPITADFDYWYDRASPGPKHACNPSLSTGSYASLVFENETTGATRNNSVPTAVNLTPATSYDCIVGTKNGSGGYCNTSGGSNSFGELKWDATNKKLLILGTVYIDGSAYISNASLTTITYSCYGSLYTSGTILVKNTKICGQYFDPTCTQATGWFSGSWWPVFNWDFFVADGDGGAGGASSQGGLVGAGDGIKFINSFFQGGLYATNAVHFDTTSGVEGPAMAGNIIFDGNYTSVWGTSGSPVSANSSSYMPSGTPGIAQDSKPAISPPVYTSG
jgi:hypothetical protein